LAVKKNIRWTFWIAVVLLGTALILTGCTSKEAKVLDFIAKGDRLLAEGDPVRAILEYKNALQMDPKSAKATFGLGKAYLQQQEYQRAFSAFKSTLEIDPELDESRVEVAWLLAMGKQGEPALLELAQVRHPEAFQPRFDIIKARALLARENYQEALDTLSQIPDGQQNKEVQAMLAFSFQAVGAPDKMQQVAARWRELDTGDPSSYLFLARYALDHGEKAEALKELQKMLDANQGDTKLAMLRAQLLERWGFIKEAEAAFENLPTIPETLAAQADFWVRVGNRDKAHSILESLIASAPDNVPAVVKLAQVLAEENNLKAASELIEKSLKMDLKKADREILLLAKGTLMARQADWEGAKKISDEVLAENQGNLDAHLLLGKVLLSTRNSEDAEIQLNQVAVARPKDEETQMLLIRSQVLNKKESLAVDTLKRAVEANPESVKLRLELVYYYLTKGEPDQVSRVLDKGLELQPTNLVLLKTRGEFEVVQKDLGRAERDFHKIIDIRPDLPLGYMEMGQLMLAQSKVNEANNWFKQALDRENGWQAAVPAIARTYLLMKDPDQARSFLESEVAKRPDAPLVFFYQGQLLQSTGDLPGAEKAFLKATELAPQWPDAYRGLAEVYVQQGKLNDAIAKFEETYRQQASLPIRMQLAMLYEFGGRYDDAIRVYRELLKEADQSAVLLNNLAYLYAEHATDKNTLAEASKLSAQALAQEPENPNILDTAAWLAYKQGELDAAWKNIQDALARAPQAGVHTLHAAIILHARGEREQALEVLNKALSLPLDPRSKQEAEALKQEWTAGK
jgi:tetratricopeptide (TPR) repeat protein